MADKQNKADDWEDVNDWEELDDWEDVSETQLSDVPYDPQDPYRDLSIAMEEGPLKEARWAETIWKMPDTLAKLEKAYPEYVWRHGSTGIEYADKKKPKEFWSLDPQAPEFKDLLDMADDILISGGAEIGGKLAGTKAALIAAATSGPAAVFTAPAAFLAGEAAGSGLAGGAGEALRQYGSQKMGYSDQFDPTAIGSAALIEAIPLPGSSSGMTRKGAQEMIARDLDPTKVAKPIKSAMSSTTNYLPWIGGGPSPSQMKQGKRLVPDVRTKAGTIPGVRTLQKRFEDPLQAASKDLQKNVADRLSNTKDIVWKQIEKALRESGVEVSYEKPLRHLLSLKNKFRAKEKAVGLTGAERSQLNAVNAVLDRHFFTQRTVYKKGKDGAKGKKVTHRSPLQADTPAKARELRTAIRKSTSKRRAADLPLQEEFEKDLQDTIYPMLTEAIEDAIDVAGTTGKYAGDKTFAQISKEYRDIDRLDRRLRQQGFVKPEDSAIGVQDEMTRRVGDNIQRAYAGAPSAKKEGLISDLKAVDTIGESAGLPYKNLSESAEVIGALKNWQDPAKLGGRLSPSTFAIPGMMVPSSDPSQILTNVLPAAAAYGAMSFGTSPWMMKQFMRNLPEGAALPTAVGARAGYREALDPYVQEQITSPGSLPFGLRGGQ